MNKKSAKRSNEPISAIIHLLGALLSVAGLVLLIISAATYATAWHVIAFSVFGASLILLYLSSTIYHSLKGERSKKVFRKIDHSMIYVLIAGTYTPICLTTIRGFMGWVLFGIIWSLAILGIIIKAAGIRISNKLSTALYLLMGWLIILVFLPLIKKITLAGLAWLLGGGIFYSLGALIYYLEDRFPRKRLFDLHEVFHILVLLGSFCHFWFMYYYVIA